MATSENDMQKGGIKRNRDTAICSLMQSLSVNDWVGSLMTIDANSDGKGVLAIGLAKDIQVKTWNNDFSDMSDHTLIEPGSPLFQTASSMKSGQTVRFSGRFFRGRGGDCLKEGSMTLSGKLQEPEFIFQFSSISNYTNPASSGVPSANDDANKYAEQAAVDRNANLANSIRGQGLNCESVFEEKTASDTYQTVVTCHDHRKLVNYKIVPGSLGPAYVQIGREEAEAIVRSGNLP